MKTTFKIFLATGFLLFLNSCVPIQELDESYNQMDSNYVPTTPIISKPPVGHIVYSPFYYRTPDGGAYLQDEFYRDRGGKVYLNGYIIGQDNVFDQPEVIGKQQSQFTAIPMGFLPPVDFNDPLQNNMSKNGNSNTPAKRSGSNSNTYPGSFDQSPGK